MQTLAVDPRLGDVRVEETALLRDRPPQQATMASSVIARIVALW